MTIIEPKIQKGIPVPVRNKWSAIADNMVVGDCIKVPSHQDRMALISALRRRGVGAVSQMQSDGSYKVWKTHPKK